MWLGGASLSFWVAKKKKNGNVCEKENKGTIWSVFGNIGSE